jgi:hypothetical protein
MKIKTLLTLILAVSLLLGAAACGPSEREQEYLETARSVAEDIPLPAWYCPVHGVAGEPEYIKVELLGYDTATGEPTLEITCWIQCPTPGFWFGFGHGRGEAHRFYLYAFIPGESPCLNITSSLIVLSDLTDDTIEKYWR